MSQQDFLSTDHSQPVQAQFANVPESPNKSKCLIVGCAIAAFGFIGIVGLFVAVTYQLANYGADPSRTPEAIASLKSGSEKWDPVRDAFDSPSNDLDETEKLKIKKLISRIFELGQKENYDGMRRYVDQDGWIWQLQRTGHVKLTMFDKSLIKQIFDEVTWGPETQAEFEIVSIERISPDEVIVYLYTSWEGEPESIQEQRWWLRQTSSSWKLTNWETLRTGMSDAVDYALRWKHQDHPALDSTDQAADHIGAAWETVHQGNWSESAEQIRLAERVQVLPVFQDRTNFWLGELWVAHEEWESALARFEAIRDPDETPGAYVGKAICFRHLERPDESIEMADRFQQIVGFSPLATQMKAESLAALDRHQESIASWRQLVEKYPVDDEFYFAIASQLPRDLISQFGELVAAREDPDELAISIASRIHRTKYGYIFDELARILESRGTPAAALLLQGIAADLVWEQELAAQKFLEAFDAAETDERKKDALQRFFAALVAKNDFTGAYSKSPDKEAAFDYLCETYDSSDYDFPGQQLQEIVAQHRSANPDDLRLDLYAGAALEEKKEFEQAVSVFRRGLKLAQDKQADDELIEAYEYRLRKNLINNHEFDAAYEIGNDKNENLGAVGWGLIREKKYAKLPGLLQRHEKADSPNDWFTYFSAVLDAQAANRATAIEKIKRIFGDKTGDEISYVIRRDLVRWSFQEKVWPQLLEELRPVEGNEVVFRDLFNLLIENNDMSGVDQLLDIHSGKGFPAASRIHLQIEMARKLEDDDTLIQAVQSITEAQQKDMDEENLRRYQESLFDALVRQKRFEQARQVANLIDAEFDDTMPQLKLNLLEGNVQACLQLMSDIDHYEYETMVCDSSSDFFLEDDKFADLRRQFPVSTTSCYFYDVIDLLYVKEPTEIVDLGNKLKSATGIDFKLSELSHPAQRNLKTTFAYSDDLVLAVSTIEGKLSASSYSSLHQRQLVPDNSYRVTITSNQSLAGDHWTKQDFPKLAEKLAKEFVTPNCIAVYFDVPSKMLAEPFDKLGSMDLSQADPLGLANLDSIYVQADNQDELPYWKRMQHAHRLVAKMQSSSDTKYVVKLVFEFGSVDESHWFPVEKLDLDSEYQDRIVVRRTAPVQCFPKFKTGELQSVTMSEIQDWREAK